MHIAFQTPAWNEVEIAGVLQLHVQDLSLSSEVAEYARLKVLLMSFLCEILQLKRWLLSSQMGEQVQRHGEDRMGIVQ